jgi:GNAT superfamily N-acetyltransferase
MSSKGSPAWRVRTFEAADIATAQRLSAAVGWPHRIEDWRFMHALGRGFAACGEDGTIQGTAMWWPWGELVGTMGLMLVAESQQGTGIGSGLLRAVIDDAGPRALLLNATEAGLRLYRRSGFCGDIRVEQHQGDMHETSPSPRVRVMRPEDKMRIRDLDAMAFGAPRANLIESVMAKGQTFVLESGNVVSGFAVRRDFGRGRLIGPLVAETEDDAIALAATAATPGFLRVDILAEASSLAAWLDKRGLVNVGEVTQMVRGSWPATPSTVRRFGLAAHAFG